MRDGVAHLHGFITDCSARRPAIIAAENVPGVKEVHDHISLVDPLSGIAVYSAEDEQLLKTE